MMQIELKINLDCIECISIFRIENLDDKDSKKDEYTYRIETFDGGVFLISHKYKDGVRILAAKVLNELVRIDKAKETE